MMARLHLKLDVTQFHQCRPKYGCELRITIGGDEVWHVVQSKYFVEKCSCIVDCCISDFRFDKMYATKQPVNYSSDGIVAFCSLWEVSSEIYIYGTSSSYGR